MIESFLIISEADSTVILDTHEKSRLDSHDEERDFEIHPNKLQTRLFELSKVGI